MRSGIKCVQYNEKPSRGEESSLKVRKNLLQTYVWSVTLRSTTHTWL